MTDEFDVNTCLILQNTLNVTVTAIQNKREHPTRVKGFVETMVHDYCDPTFASHFRMKIQCSCGSGSVVEHCVSKGCGFNSQGTCILTKICIA